MHGDRDKLTPGALVVLVGALMLVVSLFLDWYGLRGDAGISAWSSFELVDLLLAAGAIGAAVASVLAGVLPTFGGRSRELGAAFLVPLVIVMVVLVVTSLISKPPAARGAGIEIGAWLALVAVLLMAGGALLSHTNLSLQISVRASTDAPPTAPVGSFPEEDGRTQPHAGPETGGTTQVAPPRRR